MSLQTTTGRRPDAPSASGDVTRPATAGTTAARRRLTPSQAVVARPFLVVLPVLVLLVPALVVALARPPVHTAEARLLVGGLNVEAQAVPGFVEASRTLAETYSRLVSTRAVEERVAAILQVDVEDVVGHVDATSVPESSIIKVSGEGDDAESAVRFAAAAAQALDDYADEAATTAELDALLDEFRQASLTLNQAIARRDALDRQYNARLDAGSATDADLEALTAAQADLDRARLEADTLATAYSEQRELSTGSGNLDLIAPASHGGDDRGRNLQLAIAAPVLLGLIAGVALATLVANRREDAPTTP
jgi:hypothetical protein